MARNKTNHVQTEFEEEVSFYTLKVDQLFFQYRSSGGHVESAFTD